MSISFICPVHSCCGELVLPPESFPDPLRFFPVADLRKSVECVVAKGIGKPRLSRNYDRSMAGPGTGKAQRYFASDFDGSRLVWRSSRIAAYRQSTRLYSFE
jgi:hypothetical protein